ncbi:N-acetylglucosamine transport system permease protein [Pseudonocardia thermophila]|uniref:N-acetylglucosamine transport system permease protein n=1 Tax=Pseudonocardia thermophila TaxID=1848 RepID=A0A1M6WU73_PSETH|nr:sugar ABC transporter permease [Pseudonocardia thermophila]SHK97194.1 N-acetylglucosamine transport system permease protein [Pseudonocardia thermophila]
MRHGKYPFIIGFLAIPLLLYAVFVISPYAQAFYLSLTDWRGLSNRQDFVGLANYAELFTDTQFWRAMGHNLALLIVVPLFVIAMALLFASATAISRVRGSRFYQVVFFFPHVLPVVIAGILFAFLYNPQAGLLNAFLRVVGLEWLTRAWLGDDAVALPAVMVVMIWSAVGFYYVLFSAAMKSVPRDVYEAATLDGAGRLRTLVSITIPMIWESVQVSYVYLGIAALDGFTLLHTMLPDGGPNRSTEVVAQYLYRTAFDEGRFGYASAIGVTLCLFTLVLAIVVMRFSRREQVEYA